MLADFKHLQSQKEAEWGLFSYAHPRGKFRHLNSTKVTLYSLTTYTESTPQDFIELPKRWSSLKFVIPQDVPPALWLVFQSRYIYEHKLEVILTPVLEGFCLLSIILENLPSFKQGGRQQEIHFLDFKVFAQGILTTVGHTVKLLRFTLLGAEHYYQKRYLLQKCLTATLPEFCMALGPFTKE